MNSTLNLFIQDLNSYSYPDLVLIAKHLKLPISYNKNYIINSIALKQVLYKSGNMKLEELPPELFDQIVQYLDIKSIVHLCRTNKEFLQFCDAKSYIWKDLFKKYYSEENLPKEQDYKKRIIEFEKISENKEDYYQIFSFAAKNGYDKYVEKNIAILNEIHKYGEPIVSIAENAGMGGYENILNIFFKYLAPMYDYDRNTLYNYVLYGAAKSGNEKLVDKFIELGANDLKLALKGAAMGGHEKLVDKFIQLGIYDDDIIYFAAYNGHETIVFKLLDMNYQVTLALALVGASKGKQEKLLEKLISLINKQNVYIILLEAADKGDSKLIFKILEKYDIEKKLLINVLKNVKKGESYGITYDRLKKKLDNYIKKKFEKVKKTPKKSIRKASGKYISNKNKENLFF